MNAVQFRYSKRRPELGPSRAEPSRAGPGRAWAAQDRLTALLVCLKSLGSGCCSGSKVSASNSAAYNMPSTKLPMDSTTDNM